MKLKYLQIDEIRNKFNNGDYDCNMIIPHTVKDDHVFDENLSVKQNREMVQKHNESVRKMLEEKRTKSAERHLQMRNDVINYIVHTYGMSKDQASIIEEYVYTEEHSFMCDYFSTIDNVAYMVEKVIRSES